MKQQGNGGADAQSQALRYGCSESQSIGKIVQPVPNNDQPSKGLYAEHPAKHFLGPPLLLQWLLKREKNVYYP